MALALFWTAIVAIACLASMNDVPKVDFEIKNFDKLVHCSFYALFAIFWFLYLQTIIASTAKTFLIVFVLSVAFGIIIEICQANFTTSRQGDILDIVANTLGSLVGLAIIKFYQLLRKK